MRLPCLSAVVVVCAYLALSQTAAQARPHGDVASFYSSGRITASGQKFDKTAMKAAHRELPFGSIVNVVNQRNGKSVVVEINDRGPAKWTRRTIDLTAGAAERIGMIKRGVAPVRLEVANVTRPQLDRAFRKLMRVSDARMAAAAAAEPEAKLEAESAYAAITPTQGQPAPIQLASAVATDITAPLARFGNIFRAYVESLITPAGPHVSLTCPDGKPFPEPLMTVLRRAAWEFDGPVEVVSGYRSLAYNRMVYRNRCKRGHCRGDGSQHIRCKAADFRIAGVSAAHLHAWAMRQPELGGVGRYRSDFIHVDIRPRKHDRVVAWDWRAKRKYARKHNRHKRYAKA